MMYVLPPQVVLVGMFVKHYKVEVYLTKLNLCENGHMDNIVSRRFSKEDTIGLFRLVSSLADGY